MNREWLEARKTKYSDEVASLEGDIAELESGTFKMQSRTADGPWVDCTGQQLALMRHTKETLESIIEDINERIANLGKE